MVFWAWRMWAHQGMAVKWVRLLCPLCSSSGGTCKFWALLLVVELELVHVSDMLDGCILPLSVVVALLSLEGLELVLVMAAFVVIGLVAVRGM